MNRAVKYATAIVLAHLAVNIVHGAAHREVHVELGRAGTLFVIGVILLCPLVAMVLLWASQKWLGAVLLTFSMGASLVFGLYNHFVVRGPDNVREQARGPWDTAFVLTAYLLCVTEALGVFAGLYSLPRRIRASRPEG